MGLTEDCHSRADLHMPDMELSDTPPHDNYCGKGDESQVWGLPQQTPTIQKHSYWDLFWKCWWSLTWRFQNPSGVEVDRNTQSGFQAECYS